jgi:two-component system CheB/CheR fusion protein
MDNEKKARVLLVDDDREIRNLYSMVLVRAGFEVIEESSAIDALEGIAAGNEYDVVLTDIMMARMAGWEFLNEIRNMLKLDSIALPVIVMSAHFDSDTLRAEALKCGASATYTKAEALSKLISVVRIHTGRQRSRFDDDTAPD